MTLGSISVIANAHNKVVVIPLGGEDAKPLQNIITVSKQNGDFSSIARALGSISGASDDNRYVVFVGPGEYEVGGQLIVPAYVSLIGAGKDTTTIRGAISARDTETAAIIVLETQTKLSDLRVIALSPETSGGDYSAAIFIGGDIVEINNVAALSSSGSLRSYVVSARNEDPLLVFANIRISNSTLAVVIGNTASGSFCLGLEARRASVFLENVEITILCSSTETGAGISIAFGSSIIPTRVTNSRLRVRGSSRAIGVDVANGALEVRNSDIRSQTTQSSPFEVGINNLNSTSFARVYGSKIDATTGLIASSGSGSTETILFHSVLDGNVTGDPVCRYTSDGAGGFLSSSCQ